VPKPIATWNSARDVWETPGTEGLFCEHLDVFSETFPTSGMTVNGVAYELLTWEPATDDSASLSWLSDVPDSSLLRTPTTGEGRKATMGTSAAERVANGHQPYLTHQIADLVLLKTPTSQLAVNGGSQHPDKRKAGGHGPTLADEVEHLLPTPTVGMTQGGNRTRSGARSGELLLNGLAEAAGEGKLLRTPCAAEAEGGPRNQDRPGATMRLSDQVREEAGPGLLLPTPVAQPSGNTPQDHLRKKPGRVVVTDLAIIVENGLLGMGWQLPSNGDHTPRLFVDGKPCEEPPLPLPN